MLGLGAETGSPLAGLGIEVNNLDVVAIVADADEDFAVRLRRQPVVRTVVHFRVVHGEPRLRKTSK